MNNFSCLVENEIQLLINCLFISKLMKSSIPCMKFTAPKQYIRPLHIFSFPGSAWERESSYRDV